MIYGLFHEGSGLGDQLFCYLAAQVTAERLGVPFTMVGEFKGKEFIHLPEWETLAVPHHVEMPAGKIIVDNDWPIYEGKSYYDPEFNFIEDNTIVDGCRCQDEGYWEGHPVAEWLKSEPIYIPETTCVINFRGGEFKTIPDLFLPKSYWDEAIAIAKAEGFKDFQVHTDDVATAREFFPNYEIIHDVGINWRSVRYASGAIIANSAFGIIPRWLAHFDSGIGDDDCLTISPHYWARRNTKEWSTVQNYYPSFRYI